MMMSHVARLVCVLVLGLSFVTADVTIDGHTPWITDPAASDALNLALRDVSEDWYTVLGIPALRVSHVPTPLPAAPMSVGNVVVIIGTVDWINTQQQVNWPIPSGKEGHGCFLTSYNQTCQCQPLICAGNDDLGTIYAAYALAHEILGVDPQAWWVNRAPVQQKSIVIPTGYQYLPTLPTFEFRGFFMNDEDQLGGAHADPLASNVFSLTMWDRVFQTVLRLKGNSIIVGTSAFPDEPMYLLAVRRGLYIAEHHISLLGVNSFKWPTGLTYSAYRNPEMQEEIWRRTVRLQKDRNMLWSVGYRGLNDYAFWIDDPSFNTSESRGAEIAKVIQRQVDIIHEETGNKDSQFFTYLWDEMADLYKGGYFKVPDGVCVVHADDGSGVISTTNLVSEGHGVYYHVMMESGRHNQLTEMVAPHRFFEQINPYVQKKATKYFILNVSDLRAVALSLKVVMDYIWNPLYSDLDPYDAQQKVIAEWVSKQYNEADVNTQSTITQLWISYYNISYITNMDQRIGEQFLNHAARALAVAGIAGLPDGLAAQAAYDLVNNAIPYINNLYHKASALLPSIPSSRQQFFQHHMISQLLIHQTAASTLMYTAVATQNMINATTTTKQANVQYLFDYVNARLWNPLPNGTVKTPSPIIDRNAAIVSVTDAIQQLDVMYTAYHVSERTSEQWYTWFSYDTLTDNWNLRDVMIQWLAVLKSTTAYTNLPLSRPWSFGTGKWSPEFQYEFVGANAHHFPTFYATPYTLRTAVLMLCHQLGCTNTPVGGAYAGFTTQLQLSILQRDSSIPSSSLIYYTLDGSDPNIHSSYVSDGGIITITGSTTVSGMIFNGNTPIDGLISRGYFSTLLDEDEDEKYVATA